jgi:formylglycine-generating enzyme required for sulfatase activity
MSDSEKASNKIKAAFTATDFKPLDGDNSGKKITLQPRYVVASVVAGIALVILGYLIMARAVIFMPDPEGARLKVSGFSFNIGNNFLLLPGDRQVSAQAPGYHPFSQTIIVTDESTQEINVLLEPLPGHLNFLSELNDIEVMIDDEPTGLAPALIRDIGRGTHIIKFSKHRYFPLKQEIEIEGLDITQDLTISLEPAWGEMQFSSTPKGAELYIDDQLIGTTPLIAEILETGSYMSLVSNGYKTWSKDLFVKAGTTEIYPTIHMIVADGILNISSSPRGASVTVDGEFRGSTPMAVALSPLKTHRLVLLLEGYRKVVRSIDIEPEQESSLDVTLSAIMGRIQLNIKPQDAVVIVDGNAHGSGTQNLSLTARTHNIMVSKPGFESQQFDVIPRPDHEQSLNIELLTVQQAYWASRPPLVLSPLGSQLKLFRPDVTFKLGAPRRQPGRRANEGERSVQLERPFYIGIHEVTNEEFRRWKGEHSSRSFLAQSLDMNEQPVVQVNWQDAATFCNWLSRREGLPLFYIEENGLITGFNIHSHGYRLPTEAEWAWVAKIDEQGNALTFPWGTDLYPPTTTSANYADSSAVYLLNFTLLNYNDGFPASAKTGSFKPNSKDIYDMSGNVAEWTHDYYSSQPSRGTAELDPAGPVEGNRHVIRGASWALASRSELRLSYRDGGMDGRMDVGFRIARYVDKAGISQ